MWYKHQIPRKLEGKPKFNLLAIISKEPMNSSQNTKFLMLGLSDLPEQQILLFVIFLVMYLLNLVGNSTIIFLVRTNSHLRTPMYFFLGNLSFVDMCYTSTIVPNMLVNIISKDKSIPLIDCISQLYFFLCFACTECFLLAVMAYDRFMAICNPLHYMSIISRRSCIILVTSSWLAAALHSLLHSMMVSTLTFCGSNKIYHFYCDMAPLLQVACSDISLNKLLIYTEGGLPVLIPFLIVLYSYVKIISSILKIRSVDGRYKAFSTCSSHLTVVILFYGTIAFMYLRPSSRSSVNYDRVVSVVYTVVAPMLNPFIYSLRNKEVKGALVSFVKGVSVRQLLIRLNVTQKSRLQNSSGVPLTFIEL
ncbi:olfactory receptor 1E5-like [Hyla sarda]|uniref:olfactory receptor 1E5-like n=1 Tax=Hyla sarda TaxID=327740 RepID=UPI0024C332D3|nr:olfactory receptor 1E5-like [Hyla sarda]